jgi:serine/threonine protein kinase/Tol biopolymer transport system component
MDGAMKPATRLGPYRVDSLIGAGGMGEVYLGVDTRLDRQVAIKVLPRELSDDTSLRDRFEREARTISSLNHPNICTLFDIGKHEGRDFLVMEYLQGETLADRIGRGPLRTDEVVRIGTDIANALDRAHRQGIVHRDLKPGNIMITKSGVKLLDFGLAKMTVQSEAARGSSIMATEQKPLTEQGAILGTFQYMAPEQLEGREADARSDIFALGAILYEMATGHRAFSGTSKASLIASIMARDPPPMSEVQPLTPRSLERLVQACLMKNPDDRIETAHDVALQLRWISESSSVIEGPVVRRRKRVAPWVVAGLFAAVAIAFAALYLRERSRPAAPYSLSIVPPADHEFVSAALSPDGRMLAFIAVPRNAPDNSLWIRRLDDGTQKQIVSRTGTETPTWSPDGRWIAFMKAPGIFMRVHPEGGEPETILRTERQGRAAWSQDGTILFCPRFGTGLSKVAATGGEPVVVTKPDAARRESYHGNPFFLPDGQRFLFIVHTVSEKRNEIWLGDLKGKAPHTVVPADALVGYSKPWLLYIRDGAIYAHRFDTSKERIEGEPQRVIDNVAFSETEADGAAGMGGDGSLLYVRYIPRRLLVNEYDSRGSLLGTIWQDDDLANVRFTPDEKSIVMLKWTPAKGANDIYVVERARKISTRLTSGLAGHGSVELSPDGQAVFFQSDRDGMFDIYSKPLDGATGDEVVWKDDRDKNLLAVSPDGKYALVARFTAETKFDIWTVPVSGGEKPRLYVGTDAQENGAVFSPDGKWVAYLSDQSGDVELYVRGFPTGRSVRVSTDGGGVPSWSADSREIFWTASNNRVMSASITPQIGTPKQAFSLPRILSKPLLLSNNRMALVIPAPGAEMPQPIEFSTAWRARLPGR